MRSFLLFTITIYQSTISAFFKQALGVSTLCRYPLSCSEYAKDVIAKHGVVKGGIMAGKRFLSCQPFYRYGAY